MPNQASPGCRTVLDKEWPLIPREYSRAFCATWRSLGSAYGCDEMVTLYFLGRAAHRLQSLANLTLSELAVQEIALHTT